MKMNDKIIPSLLITVGLLCLGLCIRSGFVSFSNRDRVVSVRGLAEREVKANKVTWPIVSKIVGNDMNQVYNDIQNSNKIIIDYLKKNGIKDAEISINAPQIVDAQTNIYASEKIRFRYNVTQIIVVVSNDVDNVRKLISNQSELLKQGIAISADDYENHVTYEFTDLNSIKPEMIAQATQAARQAGEKFAKDSDSKLGKIKSATQGQFSIEDRDSNTPYIKNVRVVSYIEFYLED